MLMSMPDRASCCWISEANSSADGLGVMRMANESGSPVSASYSSASAVASVVSWAGYEMSATYHGEPSLKGPSAGGL